MKTKYPAPTYPERARIAHAKSDARLLQRANKNFMAAIEAAKSGAKLMVKAVNHARQAGIDLNAASGHEQLVFNAFGKDWFREQAAPHLCKEFTEAKAELVVKLAVLMPEPAKTMEDFRRVEQLMLITTDQISQPRRLIAQTAHDRNLFADFVSTTCSITKLFEDLEMEQPMQYWPRPRLEEFVKNTQPIKDRHDRAAALLTAAAP